MDTQTHPLGRKVGFVKNGIILPCMRFKGPLLEDLDEFADA